MNIWDGTTFSHFTKAEGLSSDSVRSIIQDDSGNFWIATQEGVNVWDGTGFSHYTKEEGLSGNNIECLLKASDGKIWIGTQDGGVCVWNGLGFFHYTQTEGLNSNVVESLLEDKDGKIWIGTRGGGLNILDPVDMGGSYRYPSSEGFNNEKPGNILLEDRHDNIWIGTANGLRMYDGSGFFYYDQEDGLISNRIRGLVEDRTGKIWAVSYGGGVNVINPAEEGSLRTFSVSNGLTDHSFNCLVEGRDGKIWIGTVNDGLNVWDGSGFRYYNTEQGLSHYGVRAIIEDNLQRIWVGSWAFNAPLSLWEPGSKSQGTLSQSQEQIDLGRHRILAFLAANDGTVWVGSDGSGLSIWDSTGFYQYTTAEGLASNVISTIYQEKGGNIWIGTNKGLNLLRKTESPNTWEIETFDHKDGLHFLSINDVMVDTKNNLWLANRAGVERINLDQLERDTLPPNVTITSIRPFFDYLDWRETQSVISEGQDRLTGDQGYSLAAVSYDSIMPFTNLPVNPSFPYNINQLTLQWQGLHLSSPHKLQYSYILQGDEKAWSPLIKENKITYQDLRPGNYIFKIRAVGGNGRWSNTATYAFRIRPPWWLTSLALFIYGLLLIFGIWVFLQWRTTALRKRQKLLEKTIAERTAEIVEQKQELEVQKTVIQQEKERSDALLLNILPAQVASELKATGQTKPAFFEEISILFSDFKGFTNIVASIPGKQLVLELDEIFKKYDDIMESLGLEKIQTVGDAYLAAGGLTKGDDNHAKKCVLAGKQIIQFLEERNRTHSIKWQVRIGIHTGPITAGVIGKKKYAYDIFGDTVNIAARIESSGEAGKINVSAYTHHLIKDEIPCTYRGKIDAKGKGELDMYFVD